MKSFIGLIVVICLSVLSAAQEPRVNWFDDFLGVKLNPAYSLSRSDNAIIQIAPDSGGSGGLALLGVGARAAGVARMRLGEDPITGGIHALAFSAKKNLVYQTRVFLNRNTNLAATIGFVGFSDPENALALVLDAKDDNEAFWVFQAAKNGQGTNLSTGFIHQPGCWFTVRIETEWGETPKARVYFNDEERPRAELQGEYIPTGGICPEFQIWNRPIEGAYSQPTMWIDYLSISQSR